MQSFSKYIVIIEVEAKDGCFESSGFLFHRSGLICATRHSFGAETKDIKSITIYQITKDQSRQEIGKAVLLKPLSKSFEDRGLDLAVLRCNGAKTCIPLAISKTQSVITDTLFYYGYVRLYEFCDFPTMCTVAVVVF